MPTVIKTLISVESATGEEAVFPPIRPDLDYTLEKVFTEPREGFDITYRVYEDTGDSLFVSFDKPVIVAQRYIVHKESTLVGNVVATLPVTGNRTVDPAGYRVLDTVNGLQFDNTGSFVFTPADNALAAAVTRGNPRDFSFFVTAQTLDAPVIVSDPVLFVVRVVDEIIPATIIREDIQFSVRGDGSADQGNSPFRYVLRATEGGSPVDITSWQVISTTGGLIAYVDPDAPGVLVIDPESVEEKLGGESSQYAITVQVFDSSTPQIPSQETFQVFVDHLGTAPEVVQPAVIVGEIRSTGFTTIPSSVLESLGGFFREDVDTDWDTSTGTMTRVQAFGYVGSDSNFDAAENGYFKVVSLIRSGTNYSFARATAPSGDFLTYLQGLPFDTLIPLQAIYTITDAQGNESDPITIRVNVLNKFNEVSTTVTVARNGVIEVPSSAEKVDFDLREYVTNPVYYPGSGAGPKPDFSIVSDTSTDSYTINADFGIASRSLALLKASNAYTSADVGDFVEETLTWRTKVNQDPYTSYVSATLTFRVKKLAERTPAEIGEYPSSNSNPDVLQRYLFSLLYLNNHLQALGAPGIPSATVSGVAYPAISWEWLLENGYFDDTTQSLTQDYVENGVTRQWNLGLLYAVYKKAWGDRNITLKKSPPDEVITAENVAEAKALALITPSGAGANASPSTPLDVGWYFYNAAGTKFRITSMADETAVEDMGSEVISTRNIFAGDPTAVDGQGNRLFNQFILSWPTAPNRKLSLKFVGESSSFNKFTNIVDGADGRSYILVEIGSPCEVQIYVDSVGYVTDSSPREYIPLDRREIFFGFYRVNGVISNHYSRWLAGEIWSEEGINYLEAAHSVRPMEWFNVNNSFVFKASHLLADNMRDLMGYTHDDLAAEPVVQRNGVSLKQAIDLWMKSGTYAWINIPGFLGMADCRGRLDFKLTARFGLGDIQTNAVRSKFLIGAYVKPNGTTAGSAYGRVKFTTKPTVSPNGSVVTGNIWLEKNGVIIGAKVPFTHTHIAASPNTSIISLPFTGVGSAEDTYEMYAEVNSITGGVAELFMAFQAVDGSINTGTFSVLRAKIRDDVFRKRENIENFFASDEEDIYIEALLDELDAVNWPKNKLIYIALRNECWNSAFQAQKQLFAMGQGLEDMAFPSYGLFIKSAQDRGKEKWNHHRTHGYLSARFGDKLLKAIEARESRRGQWIKILLETQTTGTAPVKDTSEGFKVYMERNPDCILRPEDIGYSCSGYYWGLMRLSAGVYYDVWYATYPGSDKEQKARRNEAHYQAWCEDWMIDWTGEALKTKVINSITAATGDVDFPYSGENGMTQGIINDTLTTYNLAKEGIGSGVVLVAWYEAGNHDNAPAYQIGGGLTKPGSVGSAQFFLPAAGYTPPTPPPGKVAPTDESIRRFMREFWEGEDGVGVTDDYYTKSFAQLKPLNPYWGFANFFDFNSEFDPALPWYIRRNWNRATPASLVVDGGGGYTSRWSKVVAGIATRPTLLEGE